MSIVNITLWHCFDSTLTLEVIGFYFSISGVTIEAKYAYSPGGFIFWGLHHHLLDSKIPRLIVHTYILCEGLHPMCFHLSSKAKLFLVVYMLQKFARGILCGCRIHADVDYVCYPLKQMMKLNNINCNVNNTLQEVKCFIIRNLKGKKIIVTESLTKEREREREREI